MHQPTAAAAALLAEGEKLFQQSRFADALAKYQAAAQADPLYSTALVYAGDCFFVQRQRPEAEQHFLKATQIEALNSQAWRFLADTFERQGNIKEVERALFAAIAAHPNQLPNWDKLAAPSKLALKRFAFVRKASVAANKEGGKREIELQRDFAEGSADGTFWLGYGLGLIAAREKNPAISSYALELAALGTALETDRESLAKGERPLSDPALPTLRKLYAERPLEAAILLLMYRESYRPEFEEWKLANPNGVPAFVAAYGLRP
ncbi:hypothetical protein [Massilia sp. TWR1-2-2]|uniref:hypothetical protein n=1 Tax=Massilia sp. TWR1-2-2 TaxID=2804584 RepID=UPI003CEB78F0